MAHRFHACSDASLNPRQEGNLPDATGNEQH